MSKPVATVCFERVAFESELREHPGDKTAAKAYVDWLMEHGSSAIEARRNVVTVIREANEEKQRERIERYLVTWGEEPMAIRNYIREAAGNPQLEAMHIETVCGGQRPRIEVYQSHWVTACGHAYTQEERDLLPHIEMWFKPDSRRVVVGAAWVARLVEEYGYQITTAEAVA